MSPRQPKDRPQKRPKIEQQPELFQFEKLKTIGYLKLKTELRHAETILTTARLKDDNRAFLDFKVVGDSIHNFYQSRRMSDLLPAELELRSYFLDQKDISQDVRAYINGQVENKFAAALANPNKDARTLNGLSPRLLIEDFNENAPANIGRDGKENFLDGNIKQAYFSLAFVYTAVGRLLETVEPELAPAPLPKDRRAGK